jgi:hypothetical protein
MTDLARGIMTLAVAVFAAAAALLLPAAALADAGDGLLVPRFTIDGGVAWINSTRVSIGDGGRSPFFTPGVVVWDGGSLIGGSAVGADLDLASQTLRLVPHPTVSYESVSAHATVSQMLNEASVEVDARRHALADSNVCVVMGGAGDLRLGHSVEDTLDELRSYALGRREAGFKVVALTLLPRSKPLTFEADRLAFNALLRDQWTTFADGLADIAADERIGDPGDNLDRKYYLADALHVNAAGYAVMASVAAPVLNGLDWRSDHAEVRFGNEGGEWTEWRSYLPLSSWQLTGGDGTKAVLVEYRDDLGRFATARDTIGLDSRPPVTVAGRDVTIKRGTMAALTYRVVDRQPSGPKADVVIRIKTRDGVVRKRLVRNDQKVGVWHRASFRCRLARGTYRFHVYARDTAGNSQGRIGSGVLRVK